MDLVSIDDVRSAARNIVGAAVRTPLLPCLWAEDLWLKPENLQPIGAFKVRGARNAIAALPAAARRAGVVTHSSGNHGQAVAYAARAFGIPAVIVMPDVAAPTKIAATRALGGDVVLVPRTERLAAAERIAAERGLAMIPPYDHPDIIAGQGTVGLEIVEDLPDVDVVLVPVGGGGLASGVAVAVKALRPEAKVIGVEPELAADARDSFYSGQLMVWPTERTYRTDADGLRTNLSELTLAHLTALVDDIVTVSEEQIHDAMRAIARSARLIAEPSGAVATAAYLYRRDALPGGRTVAVISGGNADPALLSALFALPSA